jgi:hypothetical protein
MVAVAAPRDSGQGQVTDTSRPALAYAQAEVFEYAARRGG